MAVLSCPPPQSNKGFVEKQDPVFEASSLAGYRNRQKRNTSTAERQHPFPSRQDSENVLILAVVLC